MAMKVFIIGIVPVVIVWIKVILLTWWVPIASIRDFSLM